MLDDTRISELLKRADQAETGSRMSVDFARCRRGAAKRQAKHTTVTGILVVSVLLLVCSFAFLTGDSPRVVERSPKREETGRVDLASLMKAIEDTRYDAERTARELELYRARRRREVLQTRLAELESESSVFAQLRLQEEVNVTAAITLDYADRLANECNEPRLAAAEYRHVWQHYPGTRWASAAKEALSHVPLSPN